MIAAVFARHFAQHFVRIFALGLLLGSTCTHAVVVQDDLGTRLSFDRPPQRIVSVLPSLAEAVCELGHCHRLVGVDRYTNHPPSLKGLPVVGGGIDPSIEAIVALRPDVVLMAASARGAERLRELGLKVLLLEPKSHGDTQRAMATLGEMLGETDAPKVWRAIDAAVSAAAQSLTPRARGQRVYFEVATGPYAASESSFIGETLARLGAKNIVQGALGPFPKINPELVVRSDPDVIMISQRSLDGLAQRPGWRGLRALKQGRVCVFTADEADVLVRPGPRMAQGARLMANCLNKVAMDSARVPGGKP